MMTYSSRTSTSTKTLLNGKNVKLKWIRATIGFLVTGLCLLYLYDNFDIRQTLKVTASLNLDYLLLGFFALAFGYIVRIFRWAYLLKTETHQVKVAKCVAPYLISIALNNLLPMRAGDICRAIVFPSQMRIDRGHATASLLIERILDLFVLLIFFGLGICFLEPDRISESAVRLIIYAVTVLVLFVTFFVFFAKSLTVTFSILSVRQRGLERHFLGDLAAFVSRVCASINSVMTAQKLPTLTLFSFLAWTGEIGLFFFVIQGSQSELGLTAAILVTSVGSLSTLIPSAPGYFGTFHVALLISLELLGEQFIDPLGLAIILHSVLWLCTTIPGLLASCYDARFIKHLFGARTSDDDR